MKIDLSQFHDLMHWPFTRHCRSLYPHGFKAGIHHLKTAWIYRRRDQILTPWHKLVLCPAGRHDVRVWYSGSTRLGTLLVQPRCEFCTFTRPPTEQETADRPSFAGEDDGD